jgi:prepilin-type N-terminal cleavage/methylation domain-containing protein
MKNQKGLSLLEFLMSLFIVSLLGTIGYSQYVSSWENARQSAIKANMHTIQLCAEDFSTQADGVYAGGINTTVEQVNPLAVGNDRVIAGANKKPFPANALIPANFTNPVDSTHASIKNGPAKKPFGCVYYMAYDVAGNKVKDGQAAFSYKITAMGAYRPISFMLSSAKKETKQ